MFVDRVELFVKAGDGGRGMASFRREKYVPKGGPDGGDGGDGGSVIVRADPNADNLAPLVHKKHWRAKPGEPGGTSLCAGKDAHDLVIIVPPGTIIRDRDRGNILKDLVETGDTLIVAKGGRGGRGNKHFASSTNRTPREYGPGDDGEERWITLELKVIADVGLIGFPNAGKSTLLSRLSRATPEIADYPFTTKHPNLGIVTLGGDAAFVMADLPGLIEGASQGVGLGHEFLRHVERTRVLVHLVEPFPTDGADPVANYHAIRKELGLYSPALAEKPEVVCVSKAELPGSEDVQHRLESEVCREVFLMSSVTGQGLARVVGRAVERIAEVKEAERRAKETAKPTEFAEVASVTTG
ncbi:MAG: GTPase ObgE, partial [Fimbriiglobus sp.]